MAAVMVEHAGQSLPKQFETWGDLKGAYRLLSNSQVQPTALVAPACRVTHDLCAGQSIVLAVQDTTHLRSCLRELHTTLAFTTQGRMLGLLDQRAFVIPKPHESETPWQREQRWRVTSIWPEAVRAVGPGPAGTRMVHVADRESDDFNFFDSCEQTGVGFLIRARHDRRVEDASTKLWACLEGQPVAGTTTVTVGCQRDGKGRIVRQHRQVTLEVRYACLQLEPPWGHPGEHQPRRVWALLASERGQPPKNEERLEWLLLTSEAVNGLAEALERIRWYSFRWRIEEWHRVLKEGCGVERAHFDEPEDYLRQAAILSVVAVRLMQLRDLADPTHPQAEQPQALQRWADPLWIRIVAAHAQLDPTTLTPRQFLQIIAKKGGYLARNNDPRPGCKVLWRGWNDFACMVAGAALVQKITPTLNRSG